MTLWRPPRSHAERTMRAIRSMQNGSLDGRVVSAYPVKPDIDVDDYDEYSDLEDEVEEVEDGGGGGGGGTGSSELGLKPWTDYFTIKSVSTVHNFTLSKTPWVQSKMSGDTKSYASVHLYWNGVFQRDLSFSLDSSVITVLDPDMRFRSSDTVTVKYFYDQEVTAIFDENMYRMQCWLSGHDTRPVDQPGYRIFWNGTLEAPPIGSNSGTITVTGGRYHTLQATGGWKMRFALPVGQKIPLGDDVQSVTWRISYDTGATASIGLSPVPFYAQGSNYGSTVCNKTECGLGTGECGPDTLILLRSSVTVGDFTPSFGPIGGTVFATGETGINLARQINNDSGSLTWNSGASVSFELPIYPGIVPGNAGCTYGGGAGNGENTVYGRYSYDKAEYQIKMGVTATVNKR